MKKIILLFACAVFISATLISCGPPSTETKNNGTEVKYCFGCDGNGTEVGEATFPIGEQYHFYMSSDSARKHPTIFTVVEMAGCEYIVGVDRKHTVVSQVHKHTCKHCKSRQEIIEKEQPEEVYKVPDLGF